MMYKVSLHDEVTYNIDDATSEDNAVTQALELWDLRIPYISVTPVLPCEVGPCPYDCPSCHDCEAKEGR